MHLIIDGIIFETQRRGGISRIFHEVLPRLHDIDADIQIEIITAGFLRQNVPDSPNISHTKLLPLNKMFPYDWKVKVRQWQIEHLARKPGHAIWFSTYYTLSPSWIKKKAIFVYDMIHELYPIQFDRSDKFKSIKRSSIKQSDKIICISETTKEDLLDIYDIEEKRVEFAYLACSDIFAVQNLKRKVVSTDKPFLLYVGVRSYYKGFHTLVQAYREWKRQDKFDLIVVGRKWSHNEKKLFKQYGIDHRVHLLSNVNDETLASLYNGAAAFVYPSLYEGFGIPILESMRCGCPLVASDIPTTREIAKDVPYYFDASSPQSLIEAIELAITQGRNSKKVQAGLNLSTEFSWDKTAQAIHKVLSEIHL